MVGWKIQFSDGTQGWQIMTGDLYPLGLYTTSGQPLLKKGDYSCTDTGADMKLGVLPLPDWAASLEVPG